ncbi:MAG: type II/IV secretion system protein [Gammaproteobacteria bacterium]|nr:type II/IV secretion system protein [Gammaproteobacteria bacterium]
MSERKALGAGKPIDQGELMDALVADGVISETDARRLRYAPRVRDAKARHPLNFVADQGLADTRPGGRVLDMECLLAWLGERLGQSIYHIDPLRIDAAAVTEVMSFAFARRHRILAVESNAREVVIAGAEPLVSNWEPDLARTLRRPIRRVVVDPSDIDRYTVEFYSLAKSVSGARGLQGPAAGLANFEQLVELGKQKDPDANDQHIVSIVDWLLQYAFEQRASDIHIEPRREQANVRFRIDGVLHHVYHLPAAVSMAVTSRLKILGRMDLAEKRRPQDGRLKTRVPSGGEVELRLSTLPTAFGEKLVMRIFDPEVLVRSFRDLGLADEDHALWTGMVEQPHGIVLVTGPTGSGKTTTLYSTLKQLATPEVNVSTIEDPIEMVEPSFNQVQVQHGIGLDFASGVRALLRQDPDVIMIGEIRDQETAEMAVQAALTGHLVLSTLHTNDSPSAITRLLELGVPAYLIRATVLGVMAQRLVRVLCPHCKVAGTIDDESWNRLVAPWKAKAPATVYSAAGCLECRNTGFAGRQGIYEILRMDAPAQAALREHCDTDELRRIGMRGGMKTLRLSGARKIAAGLTTLEEVLRVAPSEQGRDGA